MTDPNLHYHATDHGMRWDASDPIGSAHRMIEASATSSKFRGSPVIACISALVSEIERIDRAEQPSGSEVPIVVQPSAFPPDEKLANWTMRDNQRQASQFQAPKEGTDQ